MLKKSGMTRTPRNGEGPHAGNGTTFGNLNAPLSSFSIYMGLTHTFLLSAKHAAWYPQSADHV